MIKPCCCALLVLICWTTSARAATPAQIDQALTNAKKWLYAQQQANGTWEEAQPSEVAPEKSPSAGQSTGRTALAVLALLYSGESNQDPRIKKAIDYLQKTPTAGVYALGLRCQLWLLLPSTDDTRKAMLRDSKILLNSVKQTGNAKGMYDYIYSTGNDYSHSRSQYAVLGMWAAQQSGVEVPDAYWKLVEDGWKRNQDKSGGWTYTHPSDNSRKIAVTPGMTTVGVASLYLTQEFLRGQEGVSCKGNQSNAAIEHGLEWLGANMSLFASDTPYPRDFPYLTLYAYERVGTASGRRYFGGIDWFEKGSTWAVKKQGASGGWTDNAVGSFVPMVNTAFTMLFLSKGRAPVVISKLEYTDASGKPAKWNQRGNDTTNLVHWMSRTLERELSYQIVDFKASLSDMLETPLLYIAGSEAVNLSDENKAKLKGYIEGGGIVVANADCGGAAFTTSIKNLAKELFPDSEFTELPPEDPIYTSNFPRRKWKSKPGVLSLNNGARQQIILIPQSDPAKSWQLEDKKGKPEMFELGADLLLYAVDRQNLRYRGDRYYEPGDANIKADRTIEIARLQYPGFWDPEPGGWRRLNNLLRRTESTELAVKTVELGKAAIGDTKIAHLTGTSDYKFKDAELAEMQKFAKGGGTLVIDVAGGNPKFAITVEAAIAAMFPNNKLDVLPPDHPLYTAGGGEPDEISYRNFAVRNGVGKVRTPRLQGLTLDGKLAVIYSREDLSVGLVGQAVDGINGYSAETATNLMTRIINFVDGRPVPKPKATARPGSQSATQPSEKNKKP